MIKKIAMLFPGQGPQYPGMGKVFHDRSAAVRQVYEQASELLQYDLAAHSFQGTFTEISDTRYAQPALLVAGYAAFLQWKELFAPLGQPAFLAGHSMGEITALLCGGALGFDDAVRLSVKRGELMGEVTARRGGTMAAIKELHWKTTEAICQRFSTTDNYVTIAAYNTDMQVVITGHETAVSAAGEAAMEQGGVFVPLNITVASHCPFMEEITAEYAAFIAGCHIQLPVAAVYSCLTGAIYRSLAAIRENLARQLTAPVLWRDIMKDIYRKGGGIFLEAGPGTALGKFVDTRQGTVLSLEKLAPREISEVLRPQLPYMANPLTKCLALIVSVPDHAGDAITYEQEVGHPYRRLQSLQEDLEKEERLPGDEEIKLAVDTLISTCRAKQAPPALLQAVQQELLQSFPAAAAYIPSYQPATVIAL